MEKKLFWRFGQISRSYRELQSFEFSVSDVIPANVQNIWPLVFFAFLLVLWSKNLLWSFTVFLTIFYELVKLQSFEWINCISTSMMSYSRMNIKDMLIVADT